jgi:hypothetical protein
MTNLKQLTTVALALVAVAAPATASAVGAPLKSDAAMRKGVRDFARVEAHGAKPSRIHVTCAAGTKLGTTIPCSGTFRLTLHGRSADYRLTKKAAAFRNSPGSVEYRLYARSAKTVVGLPQSTGGFMGFLQSSGS